MRRLPAAIVLLAVFTAGCANENIGRRHPWCDFGDGVSTEMIMQAQAVPTARYGPCIDDLPPGWSYVHQQAQAGRARFWLDSDRLGDDFAEIILSESCAHGPVVPIPAPEEDISAVAESTVAVEPVGITLIPLTPATVDYAASVGVTLADRNVEGRPLDLTLEEHGSARDRIAEALAAGRFALTVDQVNELNGTVSLQISGESPKLGIPLDEALEEMEERVPDPRYRGSWYFTFEGGCIEWRIDASGPEVADLSREMRRAVGFMRLDVLREIGAENGFLIREG